MCGGSLHQISSLAPKRWPVHQLVLNELDAFTWGKANKKTIWIHTAVRGRFSGYWIHLGHNHNLLPQMC